MKKIISLVIIVLIFSLLLSFYLIAQVRDPGIPRAWWGALKAYIDIKSSVHTLAITHDGTPHDRILAVFTPLRAVTVDRIDVYAHAPADSDSTALEVANGRALASCIIDSGGAAQSWHSLPSVQFDAAYPCTVRFSDDRFTGEFVSGADSAAVIIQYHVSP